MDYQNVIDEITAEIARLPPAGHVADYIPELSKVRGDHFGIALTCVDGSLYEAGESEQRFSTQSIAKVFAFMLALTCAPEEVWRRIGVEPSGNPFNSLVQLEYEFGIPRNPFINAGALVIADILLTHLDDPADELLTMIRTMAGEPSIGVNERVAQSELESSHRNHALANFMKSFGNLHGDVQRVIELYVKICAVEMNCRELARAFLCLADDEICQRAGVSLDTSQIRRINALMLTCGFYDESGAFASGVGLPGKSGVGGGIAAVRPREYAVAVWSPRLNRKSNSYYGTLALRRLTDLTDTSIF